MRKAEDRGRRTEDRIWEEEAEMLKRGINNKVTKEQRRPMKKLKC